jgi:hypothetical protein
MLSDLKRDQSQQVDGPGVPRMHFEHAAIQLLGLRQPAGPMMGQARLQSFRNARHESAVQKLRIV